jgi:polyisoprenoid-binding protein YceI
VAIAPGRHLLGPQDGTLEIRTYREGMAARAGHDLIIDVGDWQATLEVLPEAAGSSIALTADPRSLRVREGLGGVKPLTDKDRAEIRQTIDDKVLRGEPIEFRSTDVQPAGEGRLTVDGELTLAGRVGPVSAELDVTPDGHVRATIPLTQTAWGIKPYRGLMGALKVRDELEVVIDAQLPPG